MQPAQRETDRCGENVFERQNACEPQQNICGQYASQRQPRCDTAQNICRSYTPATRCGERFAAVPWEDGEDAGMPASAQHYVAPQLQRPIAAQPGTGTMPQAPSMQPSIRPSMQVAQPNVAMQQPGMGGMPIQPGTGTMPQAPSMQPTIRPPVQTTQPNAAMQQPGMGGMPMQPGTGAVPQAPSMQPTVRPPAQAAQPGATQQPNMNAQPGVTIQTQPGVGAIPPLPPMQPGNGVMPQAPMQPTVRPPMQGTPPSAMPQPGMGAMPMQPGNGAMPQAPSMQPTVRPPMQGAQPGAAPQPNAGTQPGVITQIQPGLGTIPPLPPMQPGMGTMPQAPSMQPGVMPQPNMGTQPGMEAIPQFPPMQPGMEPIPQIPSTPPAMSPPSPATQPQFGTPMQPNNGAGMTPQPPFTQPAPRPPQQGTGIQGGQGTMRPPTIQVPEIMQPMLPSDDDQTPTARQPGMEGQQPMSPANSAALQQILQQASEIFPEQDMGSNSVPASAAAPQAASRVAQTSEEWQREVDALLQDHTPEAPSAEVAAPVPGGRRQSTANPFPGQFPDSEWVRIDPPNGEGYFYEGHMRRGNERFCITAVPGEYRPVPPRHLQGQGFGRYIPSRSGGCWVRIQKEH